MKYDIVDNFAEIKHIPCVLKVGNLDRVINPELSVVVPTYKRTELLEETIDSILNQNDVDFKYEIVVVDNDDSSDANETELMLRKRNIPNLFYYKNNVNVGAVGNWNRCVLLARSKWIIMCHDDDLLKEDCLSTIHKIIIEHQNDKIPIGYIRSSSEPFYETGLNAVERKKPKRFPKKRTALIHQGYSDVIWGGGVTWVGAPTCGTLLNREAVFAVGGYNKSHYPCPDCYVPYHMLGNYGVFKTYYSFGRYRWGQNDTYRKTTLVRLIAAYYEFLEILSNKHRIVKFFRNEHYADCVKYYIGKGKEVGVEITDIEIASIKPLRYSKVKLKLLYFCRKVNNRTKVILAR